MFSYSSLVNKGKLTLPSVDSWGTNNNIQRDPPKSITTRRIDKVSDNNDITKMIDNSDRSTEAILRFSRGVNPSVSVMYSNHGGSMQNFGNQQSFLPYRINKDGDFHPPVPAPQDLLPLSRLPRNTIEVNTKPSMPHYTKELENSRNQTASKNVHQEIISASVRAPRTYMLQKPFQEPFEIKYNIQNPISVSGYSGKIAFSDRTVQDSDIIPSKTINVDTMHLSAETNKQDKRKKIDEGSFDFSKIRTQEVTLIEYQTALQGNQKTDMEKIHEGFELDRNIPVYDSFSNMKGLSHIKFANDNEILLERNLPEYQTHSNLTSNEKRNNLIHKDIELDRNLPEYQLYSNAVGVKGNSVITPDKEIILDRNMPEYQMHSNVNNGTKIAFMHNDIVLDRNVPEHHSFSNISGNQKTNFLQSEKDMVLSRNVPEHTSFSNTSGNQKMEFIHDDIELARVLPEHEAQTNISQNMRKTLIHDKMKEYERKSILSQMSTNDSRKGDESKVTSRNFNHLHEKIQAGEFTNPGFVPQVDRMHNTNYKMDNEKSKMAKESFLLSKKN